MDTLEAEHLDTRGLEVFPALDQVVNDGWDRIKRGRFFSHVLSQGMSTDLYRRLMVETYHYTRHNSINQAVAAYRVDPDETKLLRFVYRHAAEELGHEKLVVHDLRAAGLWHEGVFDAPPLAPTQALINYLYSVALNGGAVPRLGYSYWAESAYDHLGDLLQRMRSDLGLTDRQMTFVVEHQGIDVRHAQQVREAIQGHVRTDEQCGAVVEVARTTLYLTGAMLEAVLDEHLAGLGKAAAPLEGAAAST